LGDQPEIARIIPFVDARHRSPRQNEGRVVYIRHGYDVISGYVVEENASLDTVGVIPRNNPFIPDAFINIDGSPVVTITLAIPINLGVP
jgi:hypothetical protein